MISTIDMTTGVWESERTAPDVRLAADDSMPRMDVSQATTLLQAGLCEYETLHPLHAGMPVEVAALDLGDFLARMEDSVI